MKYLVLLALLLVGCERPFIVDMDEYKEKVVKYCSNCGGVRSAFINKYGNEISCVDGTSLSQHFNEPPKVLILGNCK